MDLSTRPRSTPCVLGDHRRPGVAERAMLAGDQRAARGGHAYAYRLAIADYVDRLTAVGLAVIVDLHWSAPGAQKARGQQPMADRDHAPDFWRSVAGTFRDNGAVLFDLYNEPYPDHDGDGELGWKCVRDGGRCPGVGFVAAGMQELVDAVRSTGARNPLLVAGPQHAGGLEPVDGVPARRPLRSLSRRSTSTVRNRTRRPAGPRSAGTVRSHRLAQQVPVVIGEMGNTDCTSVSSNRSCGGRTSGW